MSFNDELKDEDDEENAECLMFEDGTTCCLFLAISTL